ncbi:hypothetical protein I5G05_24125, partial [Pseudomonas aeruginosa]|nr:hypothetical protein [Pseudomonas aeruginosa]
SLRVCLRLPAYSASAKVICFIRKLGGWRSAILPKSESLFQTVLRLLIHAEIEDFLERKAKENLDRIELQLVKSATGSSRIFPELFYIAAVTNRPLDAVLAFDVGALKGHISGIIGTARGMIKENNGIKEGSFNTLSVFAGKTADEVDSTLSASLNSYGKSRGDVAHQSTRHSSTINAPSAEFASAKDLVEGLALYFDLTS